MEDLMPHIILKTRDDFSLSSTVMSGQCFRWYESGGGYNGIVGGRSVTVFQTNDSIELHGAAPEDAAFWNNYFDLERDYTSINNEIIKIEPRLSQCESFARGVRILRQEPFEALCSFIISQNNNIPRIRGIILRLCEKYGKKIEGGYAFPTPEALLSASNEDFTALGLGYRAPYLADAVQRVTDGRFDIEHVSSLPTDELRRLLLEIHGVGPKVAECVLLYGFSRLECFPVDTWIKKALRELLGNDSPIVTYPYAGIAQQYIFEFIRTNYDRKA